MDADAEERGEEGPVKGKGKKGSAKGKGKGKSGGKRKASGKGKAADAKGKGKVCGLSVLSSPLKVSHCMTHRMTVCISVVKRLNLCGTVALRAFYLLLHKGCVTWTNEPTGSGQDGEFQRVGQYLSFQPRRRPSRRGFCTICNNLSSVISDME